MDPLVVDNIVKEIIDLKVKNLNPETEKYIIGKVIASGVKSKYKILQFIRHELDLPRVGSDKKIYWIRRGWSEEESNEKRIIKKMPSSPMIPENWMCKINEKTGNLYTMEESVYKIRSFRKTNKEYWIEKGFTEIESEDMIKEYQMENSKKFITKITNNPEKYLDRTTTQIGYWIKKGYNEKDAKVKIKERQDTISMNYLLSIHDISTAEKIHNKTTQRKKYERTKEFYLDKGYSELESINKLKEDNLKRVSKGGIGRASKESLNLIKPIYDFCIEIGIQDDDIYFGVGDRKEFFLSDSENFFLYDFTIRSINTIIEYHGIKFHPNPKWGMEDKEGWNCVYSRQNYTEKYNFDRYKENIAKENGFDIFVYYSDEDMDKFLTDIKRIIKSKIKDE